MNQFSQDMKQIIKKMESNQAVKADLVTGFNICNIKVAEFHLYSLGLKYYSYLERNRDIEDLDETDTTEHNHDEHDCGHDHGIWPEEMTSMQDEFTKMLEGMKSKHQLPTVNEILDLRSRLEKYVRVLTAYGDQINLLENIYYKNRYNEENMVALDTDEAFSKKVTEVLMSIENSVEIREHLRYIYPELPMRMHKNKFFGFVDDYFVKLQGIPIEDVKSHLEVIKESFDPKIVDGYGEVASEISEEIDDCMEILIDGTEETKDSAYHHLYHLTEDKNNILDAGLDMAEILNHLLGIVICNVSDIEENAIYKNTLYLLDLNTEDDVLASIFEQVESDYEPLGEMLMKVNQFSDRIEDKKELMELLDNDIIFKELQYAMALTREGYFIERPAKKDLHIPSLKELSVLKSDVLNIMEEVFAQDDRMVKRGRMSLMMGIFQIVHHNGQEIYDHIYDSISSCRVKGEKVMSMQNIYSYINELMD